ncbi:MAG: acetyl-CoA carboxylase biotin carboxyl carrier protein subunit [Candidatus Delongbacteria bacterium]|jgi:3-methylcrotonyl-CoA carboxylase alpha subunit|nr:acetyl-CoA carboxylase biotin carboxyl carrier protein subunit [Candidatus Delongbacteria bacterium]
MSDYLEINGIKYTTELTPKYLNREDYKPGINNDIRAFIPGMIHAVYCKPGDRIKPHTPILSLEAMKMYNEITLIDEIIVQDVMVKIGDTVEKNQILVSYKLVK